MRTPLVHIGYPKTGSTWLQKRLLPLNEDILLLRRATPGAGWIEAAATRHALEFEAAVLREEFEACAATAPERVPVVSYEAFVGDPFGSAVSPEELAHRVRQLIPEARIALVVREPVELLESLYRQYVQLGGTGSPEALIAGSVASSGSAGSSDSAGSKPVVALEFAHFDRSFSIWADAFGGDRVKAFAYEELLEDPRGFVDAFVAFAGAAPQRGELPPPGSNRGTGGAALAALRFANRFAQSRFNEEPWLPSGWLQQDWARRFLQRGVSPWLGGRDRQRTVFDPATRADLREHFRPHNRALVEASGLDVGSYGYSL